MEDTRKALNLKIDDRFITDLDHRDIFIHNDFLYSVLEIGLDLVECLCINTKQIVNFPVNTIVKIPI